MWASVCAAALVGLLLGSTVSQAVEPRTSLPDIEDEVMCTICGTLLAESESPQADRERALIRRLIANGEDKDQIKSALVAEYGPNVLALPQGGGFDISSWLVPLLGFSLAAVGIGLGVLRVRRRGRHAPDPIPEPTSAEQARLEADLTAFDR
jgi:cytochrome c-type biogenesis protein CcmH/NrfF